MSEIQENNNRELEIGVSDLFFALSTMPVLNESTENLIKAISSAKDTIASLGGSEEYTTVELLSTDTSLSNKNITEEENIITKLSNTKQLLISFDAGAMDTIEKNFSTIEADFEEMIAQGNRLIAKYQERIELLEKERERLLAEIAAAEAAAARARESQIQTYTSQRSTVVKPKFNNKFVIQSTK